MARARIFGITMVALLVVGVGACKDDPTELAPFPSEGAVFVDEFGPNVTFQAFAGSKVDAVQVDPVESQAGAASLRVTVPGPGDPSGTYAGGAFTTDVPRDLTAFDALTFWARASTAATLDVAGIGNDNTGTSRYTAERQGISVGTSWAKHVIPIPLASRLTEEDGLFFFAEGPEANQGNTIWFDEVQYEALGTLANPRPAIGDQDVTVAVGGTVDVTGTQVTYDVAGTDVTVQAAPGYFTFASSDESVATVDEDGVITVVGEGTARITAELSGTAATGSVVVSTAAGPGAAAPAPTVPEADVISLYSNAYTDVAVDTWSADWDDADVEDVQVQGDDVKLYTNLVFAGVEFTSAPVDASAMTHFHMDIWTPDATAAPAELRVKLVDFGADGAFGGGDDVEHELTFTDATTPALATESWVSLDIPFSAFTGLTTRGALAQLIISGDPNTVYVDNIYFYAGSGGGAQVDLPITFDDPAVSYVFIDFEGGGPTTLVEDPTDPSNTVARTVKGTSAGTAAGTTMTDPTGLASPIPFTASNTTMTVRVYSPDAGIPVRLKVENAADPGQSVETEASTTAANSWETLTFDFSNQAPGTAALNLAFTYDKPSIFFNFGTDGATAGEKVYLWDDVEFAEGGGGGGAPTSAAPTPTAAEADVISLYSDAYTDVPVDAFLTTWSVATLADTAVAGDSIKRYGDLDFAGIEFMGANSIDASAMTHVHLDVWTPDATEFAFKLVDFGADNAPGGGDDSENTLVTLDAGSSPALATGSWVSIDVPLADLMSAGLGSLANLSQLIITGQPTGDATVYVDNIYFYDDGGAGGATAPTSAAPTPTAAEADVISLYSDAYTDVAVDTWSAVWDDADVADDQVAGDNVKLYTNLVFAGIEFTSAPVNASAMTHFHMDIWTPDATADPAAFRVKLVDFGADGAFGGGDDVEHELTFTDTSTPPLATGSWVSLDIPLADFTNLTTRGALAQLIISGDPNTIYVDNLYFYR